MKDDPNSEMQERRQHGALADQTDYAFESFDNDREIRLYQEPFGLFQNYQGSRRDKDRRINYFENKLYVARGKHAIVDEKFSRVGSDRVPYMWDFGFLLLQKSAWDQAADRPVIGSRTVKQVWKDIHGLNTVSWRDFLGPVLK